MTSAYIAASELTSLTYKQGTTTLGTPVNVPYKFTGKEFDYSTDFYYYESRYYDPWFGRFISPDTLVPDLHDPQGLNRYTYANNNPLRYTDPTGHCPWCIVIAIGIGVTAGAVSSGIQSDWDLQATLLGGVIGGVSAGVGFGTFGPASAAFAGLGNIGSGIAGGIVAGAAAGGTSGILASMAGYNVNIGLAIASGAAAGGIVGGAGAQFGQLGAFAAAPAAGASAAAISGADPGMGAAIAAATAAFTLGVQQAYKVYQQYALAQAQAADVKASEDLVVAKNSGGRSAGRDIRPRSGGVPDSPEEAFGEAIKEGYDRQQDILGRMGDNANSNVNVRRDIDQLSLPPGSQKGQYYYTDPSGKVHGGPTDRPGLYESSKEHYRILRNPGPPQLRQGR